MRALVEPTNNLVGRVEEQQAVITAATTTRRHAQEQEQLVPKPKIQITLPNKKLNRDEYQDLTLWDPPLNRLGAGETNPP